MYGRPAACTRCRAGRGAHPDLIDSDSTSDGEVAPAVTDEYFDQLQGFLADSCEAGIFSAERGNVEANPESTGLDDVVHVFFQMEPLPRLHQAPLRVGDDDNTNNYYGRIPLDVLVTGSDTPGDASGSLSPVNGQEFVAI